MLKFHLAQFNIARMRAPLSDPSMAGFVANLAPINALADGSSGFVWRLQSAGGDATEIRLYGEEPTLVNMSIWESPEQLREYVYKSAHYGIVQRREEWFDQSDGPNYALWWVPVGHRPSPEDGKARLDHLRERGETEFAFSFRQLFPRPELVDA